MPERFTVYLVEVGQAIRWRRARSFALRELRTHLIEQKECFQNEGMEEQAAEEAAIREMGEPEMVGKELDAVHRPREQWLWLGAAALLSCAAVFLRFYLTAGFAFESPQPGKVVTALLLGFTAMVGLYFLDYRILTRHTGKIYAAAVLLGLLTWEFGPHVNHAAWYTRQVVLLYPVVYAIWVNKFRGRGWQGFFLAVLGGFPLALIACMAPYMMGLFLLFGTGLVLLLLAAREDFFGIGRRQTALGAAGCALAVAAPAWYFGSNGWMLRHVSMLLHPEKDPLGYGYQAISVRNMLSGAVWQGAASVGPEYGEQTYEYIVPEWSGDFFLTTIACKLGWVFFILTALVLLLLFGWLLRRALGERNPFGRILAVGAVLPLLVETVGGIIQNLGYFVVSFPIPFFSGNLNMILTMALLGLLLSTMRQGDLPEEQEGAPRRRWRMVLTLVEE